MGKRDQSKKPKQVRDKAADKQRSGATGVMDDRGAMDGVSVPVEGDSRHNVSADERRKRNR
jgi:hypothetical protein